MRKMTNMNMKYATTPFKYANNIYFVLFVLHHTKTKKTHTHTIYMKNCLFIR